MGNHASQRSMEHTDSRDSKTSVLSAGGSGKIAVHARFHRAPRKLEDDYETGTQVLGSGYNGSVFVAKSKTTGLNCAVKGFKLVGITRTKRKEIEAECEIFLNLDHPHIARLIDVYEDVDKVDLVMECMEGGELFHRVTQRKKFNEKDAVEASYQMLLAIAYIHSKSVVHRDIKLENFLYERKDSDHMKLIDFGFSKVWDPDTKMYNSCGTLAYIAPEVLRKSYDSQCDMWSFGVVVFILLVGYMPFSGEEKAQVAKIKKADVNYRKEKWALVSKEASEFVGQLLVLNPKERMNADQALKHTWIAKRVDMATSGDHIDKTVGNALVKFAQASVFRRACMSVMAWSLTNDERAQVRQAFLEMDKNHNGSISIVEFKSVMEDKFHISDEDAQKAFEALDQNHEDEIHYTDFLAAMVTSRIKVHDSLLQQTFRRFDTDASGYITAANLKEILGGTATGPEIEQLLDSHGEHLQGKITHEEFIMYLKSGEADGSHQQLAHTVIDNELKAGHPHSQKHRSLGPKRLKMKTKELFAKLHSNSKQEDGPGKKGGGCCNLL